MGTTTEKRMDFQVGADYARRLDEQDPLKEYREQFYIPKKKDGEPVIYFCGNSLGLQPKTTESYIVQELKDWRELAVEGHFHGKNPWYFYHHYFEGESKLVGAQPEEVVMMHQLTVNLHLLMASFYRPTNERYKILIESPAFSSDIYAVESQLKWNGFDRSALIEVKAREGEYCLRTEDIIEAIEANADELAMVMLGGVNYYTGQLLDMKAITEAGHKVGAAVGFDLAHAVGNVPMQLHDWEVDFAAWCTYKYLNSGPGSVSGIFVHERHGNNPDVPRLAGWWGVDENIRFEMRNTFEPQAGAAGWQLSNAPILQLASHKASLDIFDKADIHALRKKSELLTGYLEFLIDDVAKTTEQQLEIITPRNPNERGCQLSVLTGEDGKQIFEKLVESGVILDWRQPNVMRMAPVPLYNSFMDVYRFSELLRGFCA